MDFLMPFWETTVTTALEHADFLVGYLLEFHVEILGNLKVYFIPLIFLLERLFPTRPIHGFPKGWISDLVHTYEPWIRAAVISWLVLKLTPLVPDIYPKGFAVSLPIWVSFLVALLVSEIGFYFIHRATHAIPWLWEFHRVHHSSVEYYSLMTSRFHVLDLALFEIPNIILFSWLGIPADALFYFGFFRAFMDRYGHSNINGPYFTGYVIGSPHFHAWHHSTAKDAINKNFSRDTVFMDYLFGTAYYPKDKRAMEFGDSSFSNNYAVQQITPFIRIYNKIIHETRWFVRNQPLEKNQNQSRS